VIGRLLFDVFLFLLPFVLYGAYWQTIGRAAAKGDARVHPWTLLVGSGLLLVALSFVWWRIGDGAPADGVYVPPHMENGELVPGEFVPTPQP
jgi:hypothetical protein